MGAKNSKNETTVHYTNTTLESLLKPDDLLIFENFNVNKRPHIDFDPSTIKCPFEYYKYCKKHNIIIDHSLKFDNTFWCSYKVCRNDEFYDFMKEYECHLFKFVKWWGCCVVVDSYNNKIINTVNSEKWEREHMIHFYSSEPFLSNYDKKPNCIWVIADITKCACSFILKLQNGLVKIGIENRCYDCCNINKYICLYCYKDELAKVDS